VKASPAVAVTLALAVTTATASGGCAVMPAPRPAPETSAHAGCADEASASCSRSDACADQGSVRRFVDGAIKAAVFMVVVPVVIAWQVLLDDAGDECRNGCRLD